MCYHDVSVDGYGQDVEDWDCQETVPEEGEQLGMEKIVLSKNPEYKKSIWKK